jgi:hypothetical protein
METPRRAVAGSLRKPVRVLLSFRRYHNAAAAVCRYFKKVHPVRTGKIGAPVFQGERRTIVGKRRVIE